MIAEFKKRILKFKFRAGTSRGILTEKPSWFIVVRNEEQGEIIAIGECALLPGLSFDDKSGYEGKLQKVIRYINKHQTPDYPGDLAEWPSIRFGVEMLKKSLSTPDKFLFYESPFTEGKKPIPINGLIWMGEKQFMFEQIKQKIDEGWQCIKIKIGAIDFNEELDLLKYIRKQFSARDIQLRVDANGAFKPDEALEKLKRLSEFDLHSIEQPVKAGQINTMAYLCEHSPLDIALDEELIGIFDYREKYDLLKHIKPQYIVLKPSLVGGWQASQEWIEAAEKSGAGYWITSALESNIGLNAIAQWTAILDNDMIHGLGTGKLYTNNFNSPLVVNKGFLSYDKEKEWEINI